MEAFKPSGTSTKTKIDCRIFSKRTRKNELKINQIKLKNCMKKLIEMV